MGPPCLHAPISAKGQSAVAGLSFSAPRPKFSLGEIIVENSGRRIPAALSLYLDLLRFVAAFAVFVSHLASYPFGTAATTGFRGWARIGHYGQIGVIIFFILSGYVIAYVVTTREQDWRSYTVSRLSRLYSVIVPALLLTLICDAVGMALRPEFYSIPKVLMAPPSVEGYLSSIFYVNEYWVFRFGGIAPGTNAPFWSLSFEATYYAIAALVLFLRPRIGIPMAVGLLLLAGPSIASFLPIWVLGCAIFLLQDRLAPLVRWPLATSIGSAAVLVLLPYMHLDFTGEMFGMGLPAGRGQGFLNLGVDYAAAVVFSIHMIAAKRLLDLRPHIIERLPLKARTIRFLGATTFPLYAIHFPLLALAAALSPFAIGSLSRIALLCLIVAIATAALTPLCDRLKDIMRSPLSAFPRRRPVG